MAEERVCFAKSISQNYETWKFKMEIYLTDKQLQHAISTDKPNKPGVELIKDDLSAKSKISVCVEDNQLINIKHEQLAKGLWKSLSL